jgi:phage protein D
VALSTVNAPSPNDVAFNAPNFAIKIQGALIPLGIRQLVQSVEYESVDGYADALKFTVINPRYIPPRYQPSIGSLKIGGISGNGVGSGSGGVLSLEDTKLFQPGNTVSVAMGYGSQVLHIGTAIIRRPEFHFPGTGVPTIDVVAYTKDSEMMDHAPEKSKKKKDKGGRVFKQKKFSDAVRERAGDYGFELDVDDTPDQPFDFIQKAGLSDYDFIQGIANLSGYVFWVDGDADGVWTLHFKKPETLKPADVWPRSDSNPRQFTFRYDSGDFSSLLEFDPEVVIQGSTTKLKVRHKDPLTGKIFVADFEEDNTEAPQVLAEGDPLEGFFEADERAAGLEIANNALDKEHTTASSIKLFLEDFSIDLIANRRFYSEASLVAWARQWFRRNRQNFIIGEGTTIGVEQLRSRQIHRLEGIGKSLSGEYEFTRVRHVCNESGYLVDFTARRRVPAYGG